MSSHLFHPTSGDIEARHTHTCWGVKGYRHVPWGHHSWGQVPSRCSPLTSWEPWTRLVPQLSLSPHPQSGANKSASPIRVSVRFEQVRAQSWGLAWCLAHRSTLQTGHPDGSWCPLRQGLPGCMYSAGTHHPGSSPGILGFGTLYKVHPKLIRL